MNNNWEKAPWADVLYACDALWWQHYRPKFDGLRFSSEQSELPGVVCLQYVDSAGLSKNPSIVNTGNNSGHQAMNLAYHLGARRILLLGYDMKAGPNGEKHWHPDHPPELNNPDNVTWGRCIEAFAVIAADLKAEGVEVINCSLGSALECFPMAKLEEVL